MLDYSAPSAIACWHTRERVKILSLYGEGPARFGDNLPPRTYNWIDLIPNGFAVVVGHDVRSTGTPLKVVNSSGGIAIFLDTGCGKGGHLSSLDIEFD